MGGMPGMPNGIGGIIGYPYGINGGCVAPDATGPGAAAVASSVLTRLTSTSNVGFSSHNEKRYTRIIFIVFYSWNTVHSVDLNFHAITTRSCIWYSNSMSALNHKEIDEKRTELQEFYVTASSEPPCLEHH